MNVPRAVGLAEALTDHSDTAVVALAEQILVCLDFELGAHEQPAQHEQEHDEGDEGLGGQE